MLGLVDLGLELEEVLGLGLGKVAEGAMAEVHACKELTQSQVFRVGRAAEEQEPALVTPPASIAMETPARRQITPQRQ